MAIQVPEPDYDDPKEPFALFGLAVYSANLIEQSLVNLAAVLHLPAVELVSCELFDSTFDELDRKTLGQLLKAARKATTIPLDLDEQLNTALAKRNHLIHRFFSTHSEEAMSLTGRRQMIDELIELIHFFSLIDPRLEDIYLPLWEKYGVDEAFMQREWMEMLQRVAERDVAAD